MLAVLMLVPFNLRHFEKIGGSDYKCCITKCCSIKILFQNTKMIHYFCSTIGLCPSIMKSLLRKWLLLSAYFYLEYLSQSKHSSFQKVKGMISFFALQLNGLLFSILQKVSILHGLFSFFLQGVLD